MFTRGYREYIVVDMLEFNDANHDEIWQKFSEWFKPYWEKYSMFMKGVFIDSAAKIMRLTMDDRLKRYFNMRCYNAYKYTIVQARGCWYIAFRSSEAIVYTKNSKML